MGNVKVKMNRAGARGLLNGAEVQGDLLARAERVRASAESMGPGEFVADVQPGKQRAHAMVKTADYESAKSSAELNSLVKSMGAGR